MDTQSDSPASLPSPAGPLLSVDSPSVRPLSLPGDPSGDATHVDETAQGRHEQVKTLLCCQGKSHRPTPTASVLPDEHLTRNIRFLSKESQRCCMEMAHTCAYMSTMATSCICVTTPSRSQNSLHIWDSCQEASLYLATLSYRYGLSSAQETLDT
ncbi:hypothetical protein EDB92DRAFT_139640 [Lactarius akahatsu]|uniref:Uncharacterized protein n=1 Tax=Lactarius akahatsu TaxID=416441 RepID=A0AAD4L7Z1_9AGAM|nr:hypothetical protein EDB92DRAFT_139640 [Lactarius akahatsu]